MRWRCERLARAGFDGDLAWRLAWDARWDVHTLIEFVERGCPLHLAVRIVAPLDETGWAA